MSLSLWGARPFVAVVSAAYGEPWPFVRGRETTWPGEVGIMMDVAVRDGQRDISRRAWVQRAGTGALDRAELRDSNRPESSLRSREGLVQWRSDGMGR